MRFRILGNSAFAERLALGFIEAGHTCKLAVSLPESMLPNATARLGDFAALSGIPYFEVTDANGDDFHAIVDSVPIDFLVVSWPQMLRNRLVSRFPVGIVGTHPNPLPWGLGRHPLHWVITMGISETRLSIFLIDEGVDTGEIIHQEIVPLDPVDTIKSFLQELDEAEQVGALRVGLNLIENGCLI